MTTVSVRDAGKPFAVPVPIAVLRTSSADQAVEMGEALGTGGLTHLEVTLTTPGAPEAIAHLSKHPELVVGAGTVTGAAEVGAVVAAGAVFIVTPGLVADVVSATREAGVPVIPGVFTPTELLAARALGVSTVKLFPASTAGTAHLRALCSVFPSVRFVPTGGIGPDDIGEWIAAGACAVGIGGVLNSTYDKFGCDGLRELAADLVGRTDAAASSSDIRRENGR